MRNDGLMKVVNILLLLAFLSQAVTGIGLGLFEWDTVAEFHKVVGFALIVLVGLHLFLNRWWFRVAVRKKAK